MKGGKKRKEEEDEENGKEKVAGYTGWPWDNSSNRNNKEAKISCFIYSV